MFNFFRFQVMPVLGLLRNKYRQLLIGEPNQDYAELTLNL